MGPDEEATPTVGGAVHILYLVQYYNLPTEPGGGRAYHFANAWVRAGHRVTVLTGTVNHKTATVPEKYRGRLFTHEAVEGIDFVRCASTSRIRRSLLGRIMNFCGFAALSAWAAIARVERPDLVYASSTPLTIGLPGWIAARRWAIPLLFEVRDLWPESAVVAGVLRNRLAIAACRAFEGFLYRRSARIIALTRGIREGILRRGVPPDKVLLVPNGVDDVLVDGADPTADGGHEAPGQPFRCLYAGALGAWNGNETILEAAKILEGEGFEFVLIGDGDRRAALEEAARHWGLQSVTFTGAMSKQDVVREILGADACLVCTWDHPFHRMVLANKIFDYLAAGRPVVAAAAGEMADLLEEAGAGLAVQPGNAQAFAESLRKLKALPREERRAMGARGREHVLRHYQRRDLARRVERTMAEAVGGSRGSTVMGGLA